MFKLEWDVCRMVGIHIHHEGRGTMEKLAPIMGNGEHVEVVTASRLPNFAK